jgi:DNA-binding transcriptional MerR regulator
LAKRLGNGEIIMISNLPGTGVAPTAVAEQQTTISNSPTPPTGPIKNYTVQQAAALTGLSEHNLRYYERIGLIKPVQRQESSGHRRYDRDDLVKLEALACLRATGMPIDQMRRYFELRADGGVHADAAELQVLLSRHLAELHRRMAELQAHMRYVALKIDYWRAVEAHDEVSAASIAREAAELVHAAVLPLAVVTVTSST